MVEAINGYKNTICESFGRLKYLQCVIKKEGFVEGDSGNLEDFLEEYLFLKCVSYLASDLTGFTDMIEESNKIFQDLFNHFDLSLENLPKSNKFCPEYGRWLNGKFGLEMGSFLFEYGEYLIGSEYSKLMQKLLEFQADYFLQNVGSSEEFRF